MKRKRRLFSREFKVEAVRQLLETQESAAAVARELGIGADMLRRWRDELHSQQSPRAELAHRRGSRGGLPSDDEELRRLRRENVVLREERDILKKAMAFFAKDAR